MIASVLDTVRQSFYGWIFFIGACVFGLSAGAAAFIFCMRRFSSKTCGTPLGVMVAVFVGLFMTFFGIYWPWIFLETG